MEELKEKIKDDQNTGRKVISRRGDYK